MPLLVAMFILVALFGQYFLGPPNIHSARTLTMMCELIAIVYWLLNSPFGLAWRGFKAIRVFGSLWILIGVIGVAFATYSVASALISEAEWICHFIFFVAMTDLVAKKTVRPRDIFIGLITAFFFVLVFLARRWTVIVDPTHFNWVWGVDPFLNIRHVAFLGLPAFIATLAFVFSRSRVEAMIGTLLAGLFLGCLFWAGGRASIGAALVALFAATIYGFLKHQVPMGRSVGMVVLILGLAFGLAELFHVDNASMGLSLFHGRDEAGTMNQLSSGRWGLWKSAWAEMSIPERLTGIGVDNYRYLPGRLDSTVQPHSVIVQAFASWGLVGSVVFLSGLAWLVIRVCVQTWKSNQNEALFSWGSTIIVLLLLGSALLSFVDGNLYHSWSTMIVVSILAASLTVSPKSDSDAVPVVSTASKPLGVSWLYVSGILIVVTVLQFMNNAIVFGNRVPAPGSSKAGLVMMLPYNTLTVGQWLPFWQQESQVEMVRLLQWLEDNAADRYRFMLIESQMLTANGYQKEARQKYEQALAWAPKAERIRLEELGPPKDSPGE